MRLLTPGLRAPDEEPCGGAAAPPLCAPHEERCFCHRVARFLSQQAVSSRSQEKTRSRTAVIMGHLSPATRGWGPGTA